MNKANQLFQLIRQFWNNAVAVFTKRKVSVITTEIDEQILQQSTAEVWTDAHTRIGHFIEQVYNPETTSFGFRLFDTY